MPPASRTEAAPPRRDIGVFPRFREPMTWSIADRCFVMACLFVTSSVPFFFVIGGGRADPAAARIFCAGTIAVDTIWVALAAIALVLRRKSPKSAVLEHATVQLIAASLSSAVWMLGLVTTPMPLALLGSLVVGLLLFRRRAVLAASFTATVLLVGASVLTELEIIPYAPLFPAVPVASGRIATWWHIDMLLIVLVTIALVLGIFLYVLRRLRAREAELERLSRTDPLTGALNRRQFVNAFERELARAARHDAPLSVVIFDLDHFKSINDRFGHLIGDAVLIATAKAIGEELRVEDTLARYGGEEFVMLLPSTDSDGARAVAERCRARLEASPVVASGHAVRVTASFGIASRKGSPRAEELLRVADEALYTAKREGRNRVVAA
jgi:diguanylate cyclase (GGDEF)-like protein